VGKLTLTRRRFLAATGATLAAVGGSRCSSGSNSSSGSGAARLRVMLNGGIYEELARKLVIAPFERDTGAAVEVIPASAAQIVSRLIAERAAPTVDVVIVDQLVIGSAIDDGVFDTIDRANVPAMADLAPEAIDRRGFGPLVHSHNLVIGYNTQLLTVAPPVSWADLWDARFKGLVVPGAIELTPGLLFLLQANALNGGGYDNVDPGFAALKRLTPNVQKYFHTIGEVRPLVARQNAVVAISSNMLHAEMQQGSPVKMVFPSEGCLGSPAVGQIVKGTKVKKLAERFIDYYLRPDAQLGWARDYNVSVFNTTAIVPDDVKARIADKTIVFDAAEVAKRRGSWVDRWMREIRG
jgi:putative spermidine/putrescine transport system substrate-binding protein